MEMKALRTALRIGHLLNRIVILPAFHCYNCNRTACQNQAGHCGLDTHIQMSHFNKYFNSKYREHMFLSHPKVPAEVLGLKSPKIYMESKVDSQGFSQNEKGAKIHFKVKKERGMSSEELLKCLDPFKQYSVLQFVSLYGVLEGLPHSKDSEDFERQLRNGLRKVVY